MGAKLKHLAIRSENYTLAPRFYQSVFGMKGSSSGRPEDAVALSDGYLGLNFNPRHAGYPSRLDHFGFEVDSVDEIEYRLRDAYPRGEMLKRPSNRPFAGITMHDPEGNYFDLSATSMENRRDVYIGTAAEVAPCHVHHVVLRAMEPETLCSFYRDIFDLEEQEKAGDNPNYTLFDGRIRFVITPWQLSDYSGGSVGATGLDHIGFAVESLQKFDADLEHLKRRNPRLQPLPLGYGEESEARLRLFQRCHYGQRQLADPDGVLLDVVQA